MKSRTLALASLAVVVGWAMPRLVLAQDDAEAPGPRIITVSSFELPYGDDRGKVLDWMEKWFAPGAALNPNVINRRLAFHAWGSRGDQVLVITEYPSMEALAAGCGQPCADYRDAHPVPEEGDEGYEEYDEGLQLFLKYYSSHSDEIYATPSSWMKIEGENVGPIGGEDEGDGD